MSPSYENPLRIGFIGAGYVTKRHVDAIARRTDACVAAVADPRFDAAQSLAKPCGAEAFPDSEAVLDHPELDAVYICTPHHLHHPYALRALRNGKHVFIEKPMANTVEECEEINRTAQERGLIVAIGHHQRYIPHIKRFGALLKDGAVGEVRTITDRMVVDAYWNDMAPWRKQKATAGGGLLMDIGVHQIDRCLWSAGIRPQNIFARVRCGLPELDVDTDYSMTLGMPDQSTIHIFGTSYPGKMDYMLEAIGTKARLWVNPLEQKIYLSTSGDKIKEEHVTGFTEAIDELAERFLTAIRGGGSPEVDGAWGEMVGRVAQSAYRSSEDGIVVDLPFAEEVASQRS